MRSNIHNARRQVAGLRAALLAPSPEILLSQVPALEAAAQMLAMNGDCKGADLRPELAALALDLHRAAVLIQHGMDLQMGWARILAAATSEYRPDGEPRGFEPQGSVSLQG